MLRLRPACSLPKDLLPFSNPFHCYFYSCHHYHSSSFSKRMKGHRAPAAQSGRRGSSRGRGTVSPGNSSQRHQWSTAPITGPQNISPPTGRSERGTSAEKSSGIDSSSGSEGDPGQRVFDICRAPISGGVKLQRSLLEINREKRKEAQCSKDAPQHEYLRPGMVLLKKFLNHSDQVKIVQKCRELGIGVGGFYRPGYGDGAKLRLQMMCLGKDWNPESRKYDEMRLIDEAIPPEIPEEFRTLVGGTLKASHDIIRQKIRSDLVEQELPLMSPDICIVNFYSNDGRLGLHQDRDESEESLQSGLPVVSFSIGDSAEFLYGDGRDENMAQKVLLESGDVLVFGGKSRRIFHGVPRINQNTAPKRLIEESNLRPGRLNLTFRKY